MRKWLILSAILFATLSGVLFGGSSASAASPEDDAVRLVDNLILENYDTAQTLNISNNYTYYFEQCSPTGHDDFINTVNDEDGKWSISLRDTPDLWANGAKNYVDITWTTSNTANTDFVQLGSGSSERVEVQVKSDAQDIMLTTIWMDGSGNVGCNPNPTTTDSHTISTSIENWDSSSAIFLSTYPVTYPAGYEGEEIPDTYTPPHYISPNIELMEHHVKNWNIRLIDTNYTSLDPISFRCEDRLPPWIEYNLWNNDTETELSSGIIVAGSIIEFKSDDYGVETEYIINAKYLCYDDVNNFEQESTTYFILNAEGDDNTATTIPTETCYKETFPYFDMAGCMSVVSGLISNLSFGTINLPLWTIDRDSCHTLGTIGDWINVPSSSRTICPQFSSTVRNIVTPFLTFVLGITIMGAIMNKSQRDSH